MQVNAALRIFGADHPYVPLLTTVPGIGPVLGYTIAAEIGDIARFSTPKKLVGYTGLCPTVYQSGRKDHRHSLAKNGPKYLRWALIEAATHAARHPVYRDRYQGTCSPPTSPSLRQAPQIPLWAHRRPVPEMRHRSDAPPTRSDPPGRRRERDEPGSPPTRPVPTAPGVTREDARARGRPSCRRALARPGRSSSPLRGCGRSTWTRFRHRRHPVNCRGAGTRLLTPAPV